MHLDQERGSRHDARSAISKSLVLRNRCAGLEPLLAAATRRRSATHIEAPAALKAPKAFRASGLSQYAYIYNLGGESVPLEADVTFDTNGVLTPGITHALGVAEITLTTAGTYEATFSVSGAEPSQMALFVNGILVPGTVYGSGAGTQQNTGQAIFIAPAGAVLTVRNHTSSAAVGLATPIGGTQASVNVSVAIEKLA